MVWVRPGGGGNGHARNWISAARLCSHAANSNAPPLPIAMSRGAVLCGAVARHWQVLRFKQGALAVGRTHLCQLEMRADVTNCTSSPCDHNHSYEEQ